jgi:uncharacterized protein (TIGR02145 family)
MDYKSFEIKIGNQIWMNKNLDVDQFRNGEIIPQSKSLEEWENFGKSGQASWCFYNFEPSNDEKFGKLYNWHAVVDKRVLAPIDWKIPTKSDWMKLDKFLGGDYETGAKLKSTKGWNKNGNGSNLSGFNGLPAGRFSGYDEFAALGENGFWWSSTNDSDYMAIASGMFYGNSHLRVQPQFKGDGMSVRCIK